MQRAKTGKLIIPNFVQFCEELARMYEEVKPVKAGKNASYIPQLAKMNPDYWAVAVETVDGQQWGYGDVDIDFSIQSCSKPLTYCMALEEMGAEMVRLVTSGCAADSV
jgi:glutaminase